MFEGISRAIKAAAVDALNERAEALAELAAAKAPRRKEARSDRGAPLHETIHAVPAEQDGRSHWTARVVADAPHARFVEFPTARNAAQPFLRPALEESRDAIVEGVSSAIHEAARGAQVRSVRRKLTITLKGEES